MTINKYFKKVTVYLMLYFLFIIYLFILFYILY